MRCNHTTNTPVRGVVFAATAFAAIMLVPVDTEAARIIEFQLEADKLFTLVENRLAEENICSMRPFERPDNPGEQVVLDHLRFPRNLSLGRFAEQVQLFVPVEMYTKTVACLEDPDCGQYDYTPSDPLRFDAILNLTAGVTEDGTEFCAAVSGIRRDGMSLPLAAFPDLADQLSGIIAPMCAPLPLESIQQLLGANATVREIGVNASLDFSRIAIRLEFDNPDAPGAPSDPGWEDFNYGIIAPLPPADHVTDWSVFIAEELFRAANTGRFRNSLQDVDDFELESGPSAAWIPGGVNGGHVFVTFSGEYDVDDPCSTVDIDPVTVMIQYFVDAGVPNVVKSHGTMDYDADDGDVAACAAILALLTPSFLNNFVTLIIILGEVAAAQGLDQGYLPGECVTLGEDDDEFACDFPIDLPDINISKWPDTGKAVGTLTLNSMYGLAEGPVLGGPFSVPTVPSKTYLRLKAGGFRYGVEGGCSSMKIDWSGSVRLTGDGYVCTDIEIINDPLDMFDITYEGYDLGHGDGILVEFEFPPLGADTAPYFADPYPLVLLIYSTVGKMAAPFGPPDEPPAFGTPEWHKLQNDLIVAKVNCHRHLAVLAGRMTPDWRINPPPFMIPVHVIFDDPAVPDTGITAQLSDLRIVALEQIDMDFTESTELELTGVPLGLEADVAIDMGDILRKGMQLTRAPAMLRTTIEDSFRVDVKTRMIDDEHAECVLNEVLYRIIDIPEEALPSDVQRMSVQLKIDPAEIRIEGELHAAAAEDGDAAPADSTSLERAPGCGAGACGSGGAIVIAGTLFGVGLTKARARQRRSQRRHRR